MSAKTGAKPWTFLILPLALAGCHSSPSVDAKNATPEDVAKKVAASGIRLDPGRWEATSTVETMEMPGMTQQIRDAMTRNMRKTSFATCLTPEQAAKPDAGFFQDSKKNSACKFDTFTMEDGKIAAKMTCAQQGVQEVMTMSGNYTQMSYDMHMAMTGNAQGQPMTMKISTAAKRVGACKGDENS